MATLNLRTTLQRDLFFSQNQDSVSLLLHGVVKNTTFQVKSTTFPVFRAVTVNRKQRFTVMCMPYYSYEGHQSRAVDKAVSIAGEDDVLGPILDFEKVVKKAEARGVCLPVDLFEAAKSTGIPELCLDRYLDLQGIGCGLGLAMRSYRIFRNQMMIDPWYPLRLGIKFALDMRRDLNLASDIIGSGGDVRTIIASLLFSQFQWLLIDGLLAPTSYSARRIFRLYESISTLFMRLFGHAGGSPPPSNRLFELEAEKSELFTRAAFCFAKLVYMGLMVAFYWRRRYAYPLC